MINHTRLLRSTAVGAAAAFALILLSATPALAANGAQPQGKGHQPPSSGGSSTPTGNDISYPQCGGKFPSGQAFGIVGVNGGLANKPNPCLGLYGSGGAKGSELYWAQTTSSGSSSQPKASLYVNTGDPGNMYNGTPVSDWPQTSISSDPYPPCTTTTVTDSSGTPTTVGANSPGCAWQYGYNKAQQDATWLVAAATALDSLTTTSCSATSTPVPCSASAYPWWLDIETANSWQSGGTGQTMNLADIQGMVYSLTQVALATHVGIYSTPSQWTTIVGTGTQALGATIFGLPDWIPGASKLSGAVSNCTSLSSFTGGAVAITQWFGHPFDGDYACA